MSDMLLALARAHLYGFLAAVFGGPPGAELLAALRSAALADALRELGLTPAALPVGQTAAELTQEELAIVFTRLMVGPGPGYVPPYGSIYLDPPAGSNRPLLWGPSTIAIGELYRAADLELAPGQVPDHLGVELAFMQHLCAREAHAATTGNNAVVEQARSLQAAMLCDHLGRWAPHSTGRNALAVTRPMPNSAPRIRLPTSRCATPTTPRWRPQCAGAGRPCLPSPKRGSATKRWPTLSPIFAR